MSDERQLVVHEATNADERALAELSVNPAVGRAVAMVEPSPNDEAWDRLERLSKTFRKRREGWIARVVLAAQGRASATADEVFSDAWTNADLIELAHWISALSTPASSRARRLSAMFSAWNAQTGGLTNAPQLSASLSGEAPGCALPGWINNVDQTWTLSNWHS